MEKNKLVKKKYKMYSLERNTAPENLMFAPRLVLKDLDGLCSTLR